MSRAVVWSASAKSEYLGIIRYIGRQNPDAAERVAARIENAAEKLGQRAAGRLGRVSGTYEKSLPNLPYILAYEIVTSAGGEEMIAILHVIHSARHWPPETWPED